jgi:hypothetical protein
MNRITAPGLMLLIAGFVIWSSAFVILYAVNAIGCSLGWDSVVVGPMGLQRLVLVLVWIGHLAALALLLSYCLKARRNLEAQGQPARFMAASALASTGCALFATLWTGLPVISASTCT